MSDVTSNPETRIALFQRKEIRRTIHDEGWGQIAAPLFTSPRCAHATAKGYGQSVHSLSGNARRDLEKKSGRKVVSSDNYLSLTQSAKQVKPLPHRKRQKKEHTR